jgi:hypothetical protein
MGHGIVIGSHNGKGPEYIFDDNCKLSRLTLYVHPFYRKEEKVGDGPIMTCYAREPGGMELFNNEAFFETFVKQAEISCLWGGSNSETALHTTIHGLRGSVIERDGVKVPETSSSAEKHTHLLIEPQRDGMSLGEKGLVSAVVLTLATFGLITHVEVEGVMASFDEWLDD